MFIWLGRPFEPPKTTWIFLFCILLTKHPSWSKLNLTFPKVLSFHWRNFFWKQLKLISWLNLFRKRRKFHHDMLVTLVFSLGFASYFDVSFNLIPQNFWSFQTILHKVTSRQVHTSVENYQNNEIPNFKMQIHSIYLVHWCIRILRNAQCEMRLLITISSSMAITSSINWSRMAGGNRIESSRDWFQDVIMAIVINNSSYANGNGAFGDSSMNSFRRFTFVRNHFFCVQIVFRCITLSLSSHR